MVMTDHLYTCFIYTDDNRFSNEKPTPLSLIFCFRHRLKYYYNFDRFRFDVKINQCVVSVRYTRRNLLIKLMSPAPLRSPSFNSSDNASVAATYILGWHNVAPVLRLLLSSASERGA